MIGLVAEGESSLFASGNGAVVFEFEKFGTEGGSLIGGNAERSRKFGFVERSVFGRFEQRANTFF